MTTEIKTTQFAYHTGRMVGRYTLLELLGSGGTAEVYKSIHPELQRDVAVKVLYPKYTHDTDFVQRFRQEARTAAALVHPHIVQVYDFDVTADGLYFIVMQLVNGPSLETYLAEHPGPMSLGQVCAYFRQIAEALQFAHERGAVHRDLKPANVLIDGRDQLYLSDFGFARLVGVDLHTRSSMTLGTPVYMAPEQIEGGDITAATDVYALGAVLYQMMTGRRPYENDNVLLLILNKVEEPPPSPRQFNPAIPPGCEKVILKAMSIDPTSRYQTAAAMLAAFTAAVPVVNDPAIPIITTPIPLPQVVLSSSENGRALPPIPPTPHSPSRRRRLWAALPLSLLIVSLFGFYLRGQNPGNANGLSGAPTTSTSSAVMMETAVPTATVPTTTRPNPTATSQPTSQPTSANQVAPQIATASPSPTSTKTATATLTPTKTATASRTPTVTRTPIPTAAATVTNTAVPPTSLPTSPPPTDVPPTAVPPTEPPPTEMPPTEVPTRTPPAPPTRTPPPPGP